MYDEPQQRECAQVESCTNKPEENHETPDPRDIPALDRFQPFLVDLVAGNRDCRQVGEEVVEQYLHWQQGQEGKQYACQCHAYHVAKIGAGSDGDVFERIGVCSPTIFDASADRVQIGAQQDDVGALARDIDRTVDRYANVGDAQCRGIVNASSQGSFLTSDIYFGKHGRSRRLLGLEEQNSLAWQRAIVIHGASYVDAGMAHREGRVGRSLGCFAVEQCKVDEILGELGPGRLLYSSK